MSTRPPEPEFLVQWREWMRAGPDRDRLRDLATSPPTNERLTIDRQLTVVRAACELVGGETVSDIDFFTPGARLALELECLLMDTRDAAVQSRWWDSAHEALEQWRQAVREMKVADAAPQQPAAVDGAIDKARFERAPCYLCGYNGPGYYRPDTHPCAAKYHAAQEQGDEQ